MTKTSASTSTAARRRTLALLAAAALVAADGAAQDGAAADRAALEAFYLLTGGPGWIDRTNWRTPAPLGDWHGVTTDRTGRVTRLELPGNGLAGPIPDAVGDLALLQKLDLGGRWDPTARQWMENALTGSIPPALWRSTSLSWLDLGSNALTGPIPPGLEGLTGLRVLDLGSNALTGPIPSGLGSLTNLSWLNLGGNALTGPVPAWLGNLTGLRSLHLSVNELSGPVPAGLGNLADLEWLALGHNELTGSIPAELGNLASLETLSLSRNELTGSIPAGLGDLANLESLSLFSNGLTGSIPSWLGGMTSLRELVMSSNQLTGPVPEELGDLANLELLYLSYNPLEGSLPHSLTGLSQLTSLDISNTGACAPADAAFQAWLAAIDFLGDTCNRAPEPAGAVPPQALVESGPAVGVSMEAHFSDPDDDPLTYAAASSHAGAVAALVSGDTVWLAPGSAGAATVTVTASDPHGLSATQAVAVTVAASAGPRTDREVLEVFHDSTAGPGWTNRAGWKTSAPLGDWHGVTTDSAGRVTGLDLYDNGLSGPVPPGLGNLAALRTLDLGFNALTGPIPGELEGLIGLERLSLRRNELTGPVPAWLGNLTRLRSLYLGGNALTGPIPGELGGLVDLGTLSLGGNELTGPVPARLGNLTRLRGLDLGGNALTGPIPGELGSLAGLVWLSLGGNDLTGPIPGELGALASLERLSLSHNWGLSGPLPPVERLPRLERADILVTRACAPAGWLDPAAAVEIEGRPCEAGADVTIDLAVFHTPAEREAAGGAAALAAVIDLMVAETNQAYAESGVAHRLRLVARSEVAYDETGDSFTDLYRLADPSDGHMDEVHAVRDRVGADLVHLIAGVTDACGRAYILGAFGLTGHWCGGRTLAHELGHNLGLRHDRYQVHHREAGTASHPAYGYVNQPALATSAVPSRRWRTIMAYPRQCTDAYTRCATPLRFSNPRQHYGGDPLGVAHGAGGSGATGPADAAAVLDATGPVAARWRERPAGANRPPAAAGALPDLELTLPGTRTVDVSGAFVDPDGDRLTYTASSSAPHVVTVLAAGARVTLTATGVGASTVRVTAADPGGLRASQTFAVTVGSANRPPEAVGALPAVRLAEPGATRSVDVSGAFADPDGDLLSYAATSSARSVATAVASGSRVTVTAVAPGSAVIEVTATDPDGLSASQTFRARVSAPFTDDPIRPGETPVRAVHFTELRARIDALRVEAGLARFGWTDPVLRAGATPVRLAHLLELRRALAAAYAAAGRPAPRWTDGAPAAGSTPIRAAHLTELRAAVVALE